MPLHLYAVKIISTPQASLVLQGFMNKKYPFHPLSNLYFFTLVRAVFTFFLILEQSPTFAELTVDISSTFNIDKKRTWISTRISMGYFLLFERCQESPHQDGVTPDTKHVLAMQIHSYTDKVDFLQILSVPSTNPKTSPGRAVYILSDNSKSVSKLSEVTPYDGN